MVGVCAPNVVVDWLALLLRVREVDYPDRIFHVFPQSLPVDAGIVPQIEPRPLPSRSSANLPIIILSFDAV
jgi:hypothetical protein